MRCLSIGNFGHGWDNSICDEEHIASALEKLGHAVYRWQREETDTAGPLQEKFDFVLIQQWGGYIPELVSRLRVLNCPIIYWAFDFQEWGQEWHERLVAEVDLYLSKRIADSKYPNWRWLPQDFSPEFLDKVQDYHHSIEQDIDVLFTGTYLDWAAERNETLKAVDEKYNLTIHSVNPEAWKAAGFKNVHGPVMDDQLPALIARSKISLSIDHTIEAGYWSDRVAQILCCGGFVMHRYQPLCETVFRDNVAYFYNVENCLEQIEFYLEHSNVRELMANNGYVYAQEYLKVENRVRDLLTIVGSVL